MNKQIWLGIILMLALACKKTAPEPTDPPVPTDPSMLVTDLGDRSIAFGKSASFDLDNNGAKDVLFSTMLVGDPIEQKDKKQWLVTSSFEANLPVNSTEHLPVLRLLDSIPLNNFSGYSWYNASSIVLSQKTVPVTSPPYWEGDWKDASHRFVPIQVEKQNGLFNGWIEVSFSIDNEKLILHKTAISKEPNKGIMVGK